MSNPQVEIDGRHYFGDIADIHAICGVDVRRALIAEFGGQRVSIPSVSDARLANCQLARVIGEEQTRQLQRRFGVGKVSIPIGRGSAITSAYRERLEKARDLFADGASLSQVASALQITDRSASKYRARLRAAGALPPPPITTESQPA